jgi:uncharacterized membrane protein YhaH (DUF805 family)
MDWFVTALKRYAVFSGRAGRPEYWWFALIYLLASVVLTFVDGITGTLNLELGIGLLSGLFALALFLPALAVTVRRLHDTDRSGWWVLLALVPVVGVIVLLVFLVLPGGGPNRHGDAPAPQL